MSCLRAVPLEGRRARQQPDLVVEGLVVGSSQELEQAGAVVEREDLVVRGGRLPRVGELAHLVGALGRQIVHLGRVGGDVVELPLAVVVGRASLVQGHELPPVAVEAAVAEALGVLLDVGARPRRRSSDRPGEARAVEAVASARGRRGRGSWGTGRSRTGTGGGWSRGPSPGIPRGPRHDHRHAHAAGVGRRLVEPERRVRRHPPAPRVVHQGLRAADQLGVARRRRGPTRSGRGTHRTACSSCASRSRRPPRWPRCRR